MTYGDQRRVSGLRREELALLAGVSASYYARLEQGQSANASAEVLDAIAGALRLDDAERAHLHELAAGTRRRPGGRRPAPERVTAAVRQLVAALGDVPAVVLGRRSDVLAWNATGHALFAGHVTVDGPDHPARRPNMARLMFLDAHTRALYADWPAKARAVVATLRMASGQHPDDPLLAALVGELPVKSPEFAAMWADHRVKAGSGGGLRDAPSAGGDHAGHPADPALRGGPADRGRDHGGRLAVARRDDAPGPQRRHRAGRQAGPPDPAVESRLYQ